MYAHRERNQVFCYDSRSRQMLMSRTQGGRNVDPSPNLDQFSDWIPSLGTTQSFLQPHTIAGPPTREDTDVIDCLSTTCMLGDSHRVDYVQTSRKLALPILPSPDGGDTTLSSESPRTALALARHDASEKVRRAGRCSRRAGYYFEGRLRQSRIAACSALRA